MLNQGSQLVQFKFFLCEKSICHEVKTFTKVKQCKKNEDEF